MGEIAEMMLDGTLCQYCGVAMVHGPEDEAAGYPVSCGCQGGDEFVTGPVSDDKPKKRKCHLCGKSVKGDLGLINHLDAKHPGWDAEAGDA